MIVWYKNLNKKKCIKIKYLDQNNMSGMVAFFKMMCFAFMILNILYIWINDINMKKLRAYE